MYITIVRVCIIIVDVLFMTNLIELVSFSAKVTSFGQQLSNSGMCMIVGDTIHGII